MMDNFFNIEYIETNKNLFEGLKISQSDYYKELFTRLVIKLDFKYLKQDNFDIMYAAYKEMIRELYSNKRYLISVLNVDEKELFNIFLYETANVDKYQKTINILSGMLYRYYNKKVIILIDEYDVSVQQGYDVYKYAIAFKNKESCVQ